MEFTFDETDPDAAFKTITAKEKKEKGTKKFKKKLKALGFKVTEKEDGNFEAFIGDRDDDISNYPES